MMSLWRTLVYSTDDDDHYRYSFFYTLYGWYWLVRQTKWIRYFSPSNRKAWVAVNFTGWREDPCEWRLHAQAYGLADSGEHFYSAASISGEQAREHKNHPRYFEEKERNARQHLDSFLKPECRCRLGLHYKCSVHGTWRG